MLHQKLFFKDLLDHSSGKSRLSQKIEAKMMPRLLQIINQDDPVDSVSISASLRLNDQLNPSIYGEIKTDLSLRCQRCLGPLEWNETIEYSIDFIRQSDTQASQENMDCISISDEGIVLLDLLEDEILTSQKTENSAAIGKHSKHLNYKMCVPPVFCHILEYR